MATVVARSLYLQAGGAETQLGNINADPQTVGFSDLLVNIKHSRLKTCLQDEDFYFLVWPAPI